jgi:hypothetical protein
MSQQQTINLLLYIQTFVSLLIAARAFYLYARNRSDDLFILGTAMITIAAASVSGLIADNLFVDNTNRFGGTFNVLWFEYGGQTISFFFIFLSTWQNVDSNTNNLKRWQLIVTALLVLVALATPIIPPFSSPHYQAILSNTRSLICFIIFARYSYFFFSKESRFSFLMALAFLLLTFGLIIVTAQFYPNGPIIDIYIGYALRISGLIVLLLAFWIG